VLAALDGYLGESNSKFLAVLPLHDDREGEEPNRKPPRSALIMECFETTATPEQLLARLDVVGRHATAALYNSVEHKRIPMRFLWMPLAKLQEGLGGKARAIAILITSAVLALIFCLIVIPYPLKVESTGSLLPESRAWVFAPAEARVDRWRVKPGDSFNEHHVVAVMYDEKLQEKLAPLNTEIDSLNSIIDDSQRLMGGDSRPNQPENAQNRQQLNTYRIQRAQKLAQRQVLMSRYHAIPNDPGYFELLAPSFPPRSGTAKHRPMWTVVNRDFLENLTNRQVKPSDPLLRLGDIDGEWEVELKIPQKHVGQVLKAFEREKTDELDVDLLVKKDPTHVYKGKLHRSKVGGEAVPNQTDNNENEPVVFASVRITGDDIPEDYRLPRNLMLTGSEVHAKIRCGDHAMGYSLFYGLWEFFYEKVVFFF
jgi:hypothetical protein